MLEPETLVDRRRLRRKLTLWRVLAVVLALLFVAALSLGGDRSAGPAAILPHIARVSVEGVITDDRKMQDLFDKVARSDQVKAVIVGDDALDRDARDMRKDGGGAGRAVAACTKARLQRGAPVPRRARATT